MNQAAHDMTVILADPSFSGRVPRARQVSVLNERAAASFDVRQPHLNLFVLSNATNLGPIARLVREANAVHKLRALFVRADVACNWSVPMLDRAGIRTLRNTLVHDSNAIPERVLRAWAWGAQNDLIADALAFDDKLIVRDCALNSFEVDFELLPVLAKLPPESRSTFTVDPDGSFLHWAVGDVHVSLDEIRYALEPGFRESSDLKRLASQKRFGSAVAQLRKEAGLSQAEITGLSVKQVSRIERGHSAPRLQSLRILADAHSMPIDDYLEAIAVRARSERSEGGIES